jgi:hypothetical protein
MLVILNWEDTPSWVPRWNDARDKTWLDPFYFHEHPLRLNVSESNKPWHLSEIHTLRVQGIWEGEISIRSGSFSNVSEKFAPEEHLANFHELIRFVSVIRRDCRALRKNESLATGFFEFMHARIRSRITPESGADFDVWFRIASEVCSPAWAEEAYLAARIDEASVKWGKRCLIVKLRCQPFMLGNAKAAPGITHPLTTIWKS